MTRILLRGIRWVLVISILVSAFASSISMLSAHRSDQIAYVSDAGGNPDIYVMDADGSNATQLTFNDAEDTEPEWSPDRSRIAFVSDRDGSAEIYLMNADGSGQSRLTFDDAYAEAPTWSPDGQRIAYTSSRGGVSRIYTIFVSETASQPLTNTEKEDRDPAWSPDGRQIAFASNRGTNFEIYLMNADGSGIRQLTQNPEADNISPAWSPDGRQIAFVSQYGRDAEISLIDAGGGGLRSLTQEQDFFAESVTWSPDGSMIAYMVRNSRRETYIQTTSALGNFAFVRLAANSGYPSWASPQPVAQMASVTQNTNQQLSSPSSTGIRGVVTAHVLNVRVGPGPEYAEVTKLGENDTVTIFGRTSDGSWGQIDTNAPRWINLEFVNLSANISPLPVTFAEQGGWGPAGRLINVQGRAEDTLRIRGGAGTEFRQLTDPDTVRAGATMNIVGQSANGQWYQIDVDGRTGWVNATYVTLTSGSRSSIPVTG